MITTIVRFSYANVWEPSQTPSGDFKFSVSILIPKDDENGMNDIQTAIQAAIATGIEKGTFSKIQAKGLRLPIRDGDAEADEEKRGPEYRGYWFMNASSKNQPGIVGPDAKPMMEQDDFYSGCWGRADVNFFPYNTAGNRGIGVGLNNLMKLRDDERLDGRQKAEDAFSAFAQQAENMADDGELE